MPCWCWLLLLLLISACDTHRPNLNNGDPAPDFELEQLEGGRLRLADLRGQVVAIRFWADWCPFCEGEMRELEPVYQRLKPRGMRLLAINVAQSPATVRRFVERLGIGYDVLLDSDSEVARRYGVIALPVTYVVDRSGIVQGKVLGESDPATFESLLAPLLAVPGAGL